MLLSLLSRRSLEVDSRDAYGFALRPQHVERYIEYADIYKEEEEERSQKWKNFIEQQEATQPNSPEEKYEELSHAEAAKLNEETVSLKGEGSKAETTKLNERTVHDVDNEENKAEATKLIEDTISRSGSETENSEDTKLKEEILLERRRENECDNTETVSERGIEVDNTGPENLKEETVSEKTVEVDNKGGATDLKVDTVSERGVEVDKAEGTELKEETVSKRGGEGHDSSRNSVSDGPTKIDPKKEQLSKETKARKVQTWAQIRPSLSSIESMMGFRVKRRKDMKGEQITKSEDHLPSIDEARLLEEESEEGIKEKFCVTETPNERDLKSSTESAPGNDVSPEPYFPWKEELECLVRGGVPKDLRGELWQAFVGVKARRVERYYQDLLAQETNVDESKEHDDTSGVPKKWKRQIEKDIPRTFPGHPALNENGRDSLRRLLLAYARHNPSVGYCQAMNFFAGILLLLMPEENAFWTFVGIIDDYFDGYYTEEMVESQVDQLVFEELVRERFPKLVNHLDYLGVQVTWISGPWFLSIFVNMLPWESVLRVWDVLLYEGNRVMLFRTALALMELYGPALVTTKDAGDAITLLQSLAGSTFDSSQLVLTACMGYLTVTEAKLQELREKHRPAVLVVVEERSKGSRVWKDPKGVASKLYSFKHDRESVIEKNKTTEELGGALARRESHTKTPSSTLDDLLSEATINSELDSLPDLQEQVVWLKVELCRVLEEKRSAVLRAEELETALMEMVKHDNRRELSARIEQLEQELAGLQQSLDDKKEQESAMLQVLLRVEQEQKITEDARRTAEQDAAAQKYAVTMLQEKYEKAMASIAQMEKRVVMAESMLEATMKYESGQSKAVSAPGPMDNHGAPVDSIRRKIGIFSWLDRNKVARKAQ
ncbi:ecotropic viral integration site 5 protein homolog isoform X4 [Mangifera indica]|uniref:ecotropic viral integration site 5 protein homolog isoform X4 n=1 Tax=Mangifera indica TaxID=29780 RepID=UPI001CF9D320|nr:ecotropic viral integration site 5 protein homolog isoform X4 [Mangifera indica]